MMNKIKYILFSFTLLIFFIIAPVAVQAQAGAPPPPDLRSQISTNIHTGAITAGLGNARPQEVVARVIKVLLSVVGIIFTSLIVMSGYNLLTAAGDEGKVEKAKNTIRACVIGLAITLGAYGITSFIGKSTEKITNETPARSSNPADDGVFGWNDIVGDD